jgi:hypothetical protein
MKQNLKENGKDIYVKVVSITPTNLVLLFYDEELLIPFTRVPWFLNAKIEDIFDVKMNGIDEIRWDKLDIDLDVDSIKHPERYPLIMKPYSIEDNSINAAESEISYKITP